MSGSDHFRAYGRKAVRLDAVLVHEDSDWQREAVVVNLGVGGACCTLADPLTAGTPVVLSMNAPTLWDPLRLHGTVVWCNLEGRNGARVGVEFDHRAGQGVRHLVEILGLDPYA